MRISITYLYTILRYGYPHSVDDTIAGIRDARKLGFRFLELEGLGAPHIRAMHDARERLRDALDECGAHAHNFCVVDPDLVNLDSEKRKAAFENFRLGAEVAAALGAETLHLASYAPPVTYIERKPYALGADYAFANIPRLRLPAGFDWDAVWRTLVLSCQLCADIAADYGKIVLMEPRVGEVICSVDSMLRLLEHAGRPNLKANFDTGHFSAQRENVVLALAKLKGKFANIHISDNNPADTGHLAVGEGAIDWEEFFRVLSESGYDGYLGLDLGARDDLAGGYLKSLTVIRDIASRTGIAIEA